MASDELRLASQLFGKAREMSDRQSNKRRWFSYKSSFNLPSGPERNIDKKVQLFDARLLFSRQLKDVCCPGSGTEQAH